MKLSTRTRYGIRAMVELATSYGEGPLQSRVIAERQDISAKYLEQLIGILRTGGFVRSIRGSKGGYVLAKPPNEIKLSELFNSLEGPVITTECLVGDASCTRASDCVTRQLWSQVQDAVVGILESITLQDMVDKVQKNRGLYYQI